MCRRSAQSVYCTKEAALPEKNSASKAREKELTAHQHEANFSKNT
jgi:hypothetical protein